MTFENEKALSLLNFISTHVHSKIRVEGIGDKPYKNWVYYLNDIEKEALSQTYQLGWLMKDITETYVLNSTVKLQKNSSILMQSTQSLMNISAAILIIGVKYGQSTPSWFGMRNILLRDEIVP